MTKRIVYIQTYYLKLRLLSVKDLKIVWHFFQMPISWKFNDLKNVVKYMLEVQKKNDEFIDLFQLVFKTKLKVDHFLWYDKKFENNNDVKY